jgi:hypothetical protein
MSRKQGRKRARPSPTGAAPKRREVRPEVLRAIVERARRGPLSAADAGLLGAAVDTLAWLTAELEQQGVTIARLRKLLFGASSEKTREVLGAGAQDGATRGCGATTDAQSASEDAHSGAVTGGDADAAESTRRKGHGRKGAGAYRGADKVGVAHVSLTHGERCPSCARGKVYRKKPAVLVRVRGVAPLRATVYELERLRCNACGEVFVARAPPDVGTEKYDETAAALIALLRYGLGLPFHRLERLGTELKVPLPAATQWEVVEAAAEAVEPVWREMVEQAASGEVLYIDDTKARVLALGEEIREEIRKGQSERTGVFTSGVVATVGERKIVLFFTGRSHAGENLARVLEQRSQDLGPPIQMCDALSRNTSPGDLATILANCLAHARRHFVDVVGSFPAEVAHVLELLGKVYERDAQARAQGLSPEERLRHHQEYSAPVMAELEGWLQAQIDERRVEPNSALGEAIAYMQNHWEALTLFLRVPGAPLDNNACERALKRAILHRKNSLFYKTPNGARVGDLYMSVIHTAEQCGADPFDYLAALIRHRQSVAAAPERWMPWSYADALAAGEPVAEPALAP